MRWGRSVGFSLDDKLDFLQRIKTVLWRQLMDNVYNTNNQETVINERANIPDFLQSLPGGIKRVTGEGPVQDAVMPYQKAPIAQQVLGVIDFVDQKIQKATGVSEITTNIDPETLQNTTKGAYMESLRQASQKVRMIIRTIAETGIRELVLRVHEILRKNQDITRTIQIAGNWVPIKPTEWKERTSLDVNVGLGVGTNEEKRQNLTLLATMMQQASELSLIGPDEAYAAFVDLAKTMGIANPNRYIIDPSSDQYKMIQAAKQQDQGKNPLAEAEAVRGQYNAQIEQLKSEYKHQIDLLNIQSQNQKDLWQMQIDQIKQAQDIHSKEAIEVMKAELAAFLAGAKLDIGRPGIGAEVGQDLQ